MPVKAFMTVLHGTVVSIPPHSSSAGPCRFFVAVAPAIGAMVRMCASGPAVVVAKPPCECPVAPTCVVSMRWYMTLVGSAFCCSTQVTPATMGGGLPCATFGLFEAMTTKPCDARCVSRMR